MCRRATIHAFAPATDPRRGSPDDALRQPVSFCAGSRQAGIAIMLRYRCGPSQFTLGLGSARPLPHHSGALVPGTTTELTLHGTKLDGTVRLWTSFPARIELVPADPAQKDRTSLTAKVTLAPGTACGIGGIALATPQGLSDILYLAIDDLPSVADNGNNHAPAGPQDVSLPTAIDGLCDGTMFDYYRFTAKAGQRISCEVVATRLGWDFDPVVRVLDAAGNRSARGPTTIPPPRPTRGSSSPLPQMGSMCWSCATTATSPAGATACGWATFRSSARHCRSWPPADVVAQLGFTGPATEGISPLTILIASTRPETLPLAARMTPAKPGWTTLLTTDAAGCLRKQFARQARRAHRSRHSRLCCRHAQSGQGPRCVQLLGHQGNVRFASAASRAAPARVRF